MGKLQTASKWSQALALSLGLVAVKTIVPEVLAADAERVHLTDHRVLKSEEVLVKRVDALGKVYPFKWPYRLLPFRGGTPGIEVAVRIPKGVQVQAVTPGAWFEKRRISLSKMQRRELGVTFKLQGRDKKLHASAVMVQLFPKETLRFIDPKCTEAGISFYGPKNLGDYVFLHLQCTSEKNGKIRIAVTTPANEATLVAGPGVLVAKRTSPTTYFEVAIPKKPAKTGDGFRLGSFAVHGTRDSSINDIIEVRMQPRKTPLSFQVALSSTYMIYDEPTSIPARKISIFGVTGKFIFDYALKPDQFQIGGNIWGTMVPFILSKTPEDTESTRFLGASLRGLYWLPSSFDPLKARWSISMGWYAWSMLGQNQYGVSLLSGPQIVIGAGRELGQSRRWFSYAKYAPISNGLGQFSPTSYEVAAGGGYTFQAAKRPWTLVLDLARVSASDGEGKLSLTTINFGLQIPLPWR